jgi:hypothetical protein
MDAALLDTCVLLKSYLCDTLLSIAEEGTFRPQWSDHILAELRRNLMKAGRSRRPSSTAWGRWRRTSPMRG